MTDTQDRRVLKKLVVGVPLTDEHIDRLRALFPEIEVVRFSETSGGNELADADALVAWTLTEELLAAAARLRWVQWSGAGVDTLPLSSLRAREIIVTNFSGVHAINMGEHALAMMLVFARQMPTLIRDQAIRRWQDSFDRSRIFELHGQTLLLVGLGDIALAVAERAAAFGLTIIGVRLRLDQPRPAKVDEVVGLDRLDEVLGRADHVLNSLPLTPQSRGLFDDARLARMRPGAFFYNIGRGGTVDTSALVASLESGHLGGAGLDVTDPEPLPLESPLWTMANVLITAHTAGGTPRYWDRGVELLETNIGRFIAREPLVNVVDLAAGY